MTTHDQIIAKLKELTADTLNWEKINESTYRGTHGIYTFLLKRDPGIHEGYIYCLSIYKKGLSPNLSAVTIHSESLWDTVVTKLTPRYDVELLNYLNSVT